MVVVDDDASHVSKFRADMGRQLMRKAPPQVKRPPCMSFDFQR
jgi:hypothetical protein